VSWSYELQQRLKLQTEFARLLQQQEIMGRQIRHQNIVSIEFYLNRVLSGCAVNRSRDICKRNENLAARLQNGSCFQSSSTTKNELEPGNVPLMNSIVFYFVMPFVLPHMH
jgi:hypothetical protein